MRRRRMRWCTSSFYAKRVFAFKLIDSFAQTFVCFFPLTLLADSVLYFAKHTIKSKARVLFCSCTHALSSVRNCLIIRPQLNTSGIEIKKAARLVYILLGRASKVEWFRSRENTHTHTYTMLFWAFIRSSLVCYHKENRREKYLIGGLCFPCSHSSSSMRAVFFPLLFFHRSSFIIIEKRYKDSATEKNGFVFLPLF